MTSGPFQVADPLTDDVRRALTASIRSFGVLVPVVKDQHGNIIDGHHRAEIAAELDVDLPVETVEVEDDMHARALAVTLNADRRQMTVEQRQRVVAHLRAEGHSVRATAEAVGVSKSTVERDGWATVPGGTVAQSVGVDGRERPASEEARQDQRDRITHAVAEQPDASHREIARQVGVSHHTVKAVRDEPTDTEGTKRVARLIKSIEDDPEPLHAIAIVQAAERQLEALDAMGEWPDDLTHLLPTVRAAADRLTALLYDFDSQAAA